MSEPKDKRTKAYKEWKAKQVTITDGGIGSTIAKVTKATGIKKLVDIWMDGKDCGCDEREKKLNKLWSYKIKARCFTEQEYKDWGAYKENRTLKASREQVKFITELHASVFNQPVYKICSSCSAKPLLRMIDKLDKIYETY